MSLQTTAAKVVEALKGLLILDFEVRPVRPSDFPWLDIEYYDRTQAILQDFGYRKIDDVELTALSRKTPNQTTFIRRMLSSSGTMNAGIYNLRIHGRAKALRWLMAQPTDIREIEFATAFSDSHFIITNRGSGIHAFTPPPTIHTLSVPGTFPAGDLAALHASRVEAYLRQNAKAEAVVCVTNEDLNTLGKQETAIKVAFRKAAGGVTKAELRGMAKSQSAAFIDQLHQEIARQMGSLLTLTTADEDLLLR